MRKELVVLAIIMIDLMGIACAANYMYEKASVKGLGDQQEGGWTIDGGWFIRGGDLLGRFPGQVTFNESCREGPLSLGFKLKSLEGRLNTAINVNDSNGYIIGFVNNTNGSISTYLIKYILNNVTTRIDGQRIDYDPAEEYQIEIENFDGHIRVYARVIQRGIVVEVANIEFKNIGVPLRNAEAQRPLIDYNDSTPLTSGRIAFQILNGSFAQISNVTVYCPFCWNEEVPDLWPISFKRPNKTDLVNTTWGEVPANQVMVIVNSSAQNTTLVAEQLARALGGNVTGSFPYLNLFQIETKSNTSQMLSDNLNFSQEFESIRLAFPNEQVYASSKKSPLMDDFYTKYPGKGYEIVGVQKAWDRIASIPLNHVHVGVTDDGLYRGYGEFNNISCLINATGLNTLNNPLDNFPNEGSHGTGVMNILAADPDNGNLTGIASQPLRQNLTVTMINIFPDGNAYATDCYEGLVAEIMSGCTIISCSWGDSNANPETAAAFEEFFRKIEEDPSGGGRKYLFVCSAGNEGSNTNGMFRIPNGHPSGKKLTNMISVGNIMNNGTRARSSNWAKDNEAFEVTLAAPGEQSVWGFNLNDPPTCDFGGTSMAVPYVTAAAALIRSIDLSLTAEGIKNILVITANKTINDVPAPPELGGAVLAIDKAVEEANKTRCSSCHQDITTPKIPPYEGGSDSVNPDTSKPETSSIPQGMPKVDSFAFTPNPVCLGEDTKLTWTTSNATGAIITPRVEEVEASGFRVLKPDQTMTYSIWAYNSLGNSEKKRVTLIVQPCLGEESLSQPQASSVVYDFIEKALNEGQWQSGPPDVIFRLGERPEDDIRGSAMWKYNCLLKDMSIPAIILQARPPMNGYVSGIYRHMNYIVDPSDHLTGRIGFVNGSSAGNVTFGISIVESLKEKRLMQRPLAYKEGMLSFDISLAEYAGWQPAFSLRVDANGDSAQDLAVWQDVRIIGSPQRPAETVTTPSWGFPPSGGPRNAGSDLDTWGSDLDNWGSNVDWLHRP